MLRRFYVGCDECEDWFHPACVGITQEEAEATDIYICPQCQHDASSKIDNIVIKGAVTTGLKKLIKALKVGNSPAHVTCY